MDFEDGFDILDELSENDDGYFEYLSEFGSYDSDDYEDEDYEDYEDSDYDSDDYEDEDYEDYEDSDYDSDGYEDEDYEDYEDSDYDSDDYEDEDYEDYEDSDNDSDDFVDNDFDYIWDKDSENLSISSFVENLLEGPIQTIDGIEEQYSDVDFNTEYLKNIYSVEDGEESEEGSLIVDVASGIVGGDELEDFNVGLGEYAAEVDDNDLSVTDESVSADIESVLWELGFNLEVEDVNNTDIPVSTKFEGYSVQN